MWSSADAKDAALVVSSLIKRANEHAVYEDLKSELEAAVDKLIGDRPANERVRWILALDAAASSALQKANGRERAITVVNVVWEAVSGQEASPLQSKSYRYYGSGRYHAHPALVVFDVLTQRCARAIDGASPSDVELNIRSASSSLLRHQKPLLLAAIDKGVRQEGRHSRWAGPLDALAARVRDERDGFGSWTPSEISLLGALGAEDLIVHWPWIGPLKDKTNAAAERDARWREVLDRAFDIRASGKPSKASLRDFAALMEKIGRLAFIQEISSWLEGHPLEPQRPDPDVDLVKVIVWALSVAGGEAALPLGQFAQRCFTKVPMVGARSVKLGNAALTALGLIDPPTAGAAELNRLLQRVRYPSARKQISKALEVAAKRAGLSTLDLEELSVPNFGLDASRSVRFESAFGTAVLTLQAPTVAELSWTDAKGRDVKSPPAAMKASSVETVKTAQAQKKALMTAISGQISRLEALLAESRVWTIETWKDRYLTHPLLASLAERLIWKIERPQRETTTFIAAGKRLVNASGIDVDVNDNDRLQLWHPIDSSVDETLTWRKQLIERGVVQPFKQAHREIYKVTDAELHTETYSNRFAGHILRQHQMVELAKSRGWSASLQGGFDGGTVGPSKEFNAAALGVEFWVQGIGGADGDLSAAGICIRVATDQVRFNRPRPVMANTRAWQQYSDALRIWNERGPLRIADVSPRVFSEAMRDVDLFVSVTSLGADPIWTDGGPNGRFGLYWMSYANGELSESGISRRDTLAGLLPRLRIADVCTLDAKHLIVQGVRKRYRIHLGAGTVFMEPDNRYLCIVHGRNDKGESISLPFEGDTMLSVILSKAFLLSADDKITDPTIARQIY